MDKQLVTFKDLGLIDYKAAWDYQEGLLSANVQLKTAIAKDLNQNLDSSSSNSPNTLSTTHYFILCEHPPVYTLGKSGHLENVLISEAEMDQKGIQFFKTNRGGDITFHGPSQIVGYPIIDLENFIRILVGIYAN